MEKTPYSKVVVRSIHEERKDFKTFVLVSENQINYKAGQYLTLVYNPGPDEIRRSYSITSSPLLHEPLTIGVKRMDNGFFSRLLVDNTRVGDEFFTTGTGGLFLLPDDPSAFRQIIFLAAGSGITPVFSLIKTLLHFFPSVQVFLLYSNASPEKAIFLDSLLQLAGQFSQFRCEFLFSNNPDLNKARLNRDYLFSFLEKKVETANSLFYICGPESYNRMCTYLLQERGVRVERIRKENFLVPASRPLSLPPDKNHHRAFIQFGHDQFTVDVNYPDSILRSAKKQNIILPYSCETGRCGNCVARCTSGSIWHSYNEVLTEKDLAAGLVLTCTGHPVGGDVTLEI